MKKRLFFFTLFFIFTRSVSGFEYFSLISTGGHYDSFVNLNDSATGTYFIDKWLGQKEKKAFVFDLEGGISLFFSDKNAFSIDYYFNSDISTAIAYSKFLQQFLSFSFNSDVGKLSYSISADLNVVSENFSNEVVDYLYPSLNSYFSIKYNHILSFFISLNSSYYYGKSDQYRYRSGFSHGGEFGIELSEMRFINELLLSVEYEISLFKDEAFIFGDGSKYYQRNRYQQLSGHFSVSKKIKRLAAGMSGSYSWYYWFDKDKYLEKEKRCNLHRIIIKPDVAFNFTNNWELEFYYRLDINISNMNDVFFDYMEYSFIRHNPGVLLSYIF